MHYQHTTHTDTDVAPLWDPSKRVFVAMMTISDYVQALQVCRKQGVSMLDLSTRTITGENESACDGERERESVCENWSPCDKEGEGEEESVSENESVCDNEGESVYLCVAKGIMSDEKI